MNNVSHFDLELESEVAQVEKKVKRVRNLIFGGVFIVVAGIILILVAIASWKTVEKAENSTVTVSSLLLAKIRQEARKAGLPQLELDRIDNAVDNGVLCTQISCLESALEILSAANFSVDPCQPKQWLEFACMRRIRESDGALSYWAELEMEMDRRIKALLDEGTQPSGEFLFKEAQTYYKQCVDKAEGDERDVQVILESTTRLHGLGWPIFTYETPPPGTPLLDMIAAQNSFERVGFQPMFIQLKVLDDEAVSVEQVLITLSLGRTTFLRSSDVKREIEDYVDLASALLQIGSLEGLADTRQLRTCLPLLHNLTENLLENEEGHMETMSLEELERRSLHYNVSKVTFSPSSPPSSLNWTRFFERVFSVGGIELEKTPFKIRLPFEPIMKLVKRVESELLVGAEGRQCVVNAMHLNLVLMLLQETTRLTDIFMKMAQLPEESITRSEHCLQGTKKTFGFSLGSTYLSHYHRSMSALFQVLQLRRLADDMKTAFRQYFKSAALFVSNAARRFFMDKVENLQMIVGKPDWVKEPGNLQRFYEGLQISTDPNSSYAENFIKAGSWLVAERRASLARILRAKDCREFDRLDHARLIDHNYLLEVSPHYDPTTNEIFIPAGLFQKPMFGVGRPGFMDYASLGAIVGHEISHSFIDGRDINKFGEMSITHLEPEDKEWFDSWTNSTKLIYDKIPYETNTKLGAVFAKKAGVKEDLSDISAVSVAFRAYEAYLKRLHLEGESEKVPPGLTSLTPQQLFFMAWTNMWCENLDRQSMLNEIFSENYAHSLPIIRAELPVLLTPNFYETFNCSSRNISENGIWDSKPN